MLLLLLKGCTSLADPNCPKSYETLMASIVVVLVLVVVWKVKIPTDTCVVINSCNKTEFFVLLAYYCFRVRLFFYCT